MTEKKTDAIMKFGPEWLHNLSQDTSAPASNSNAANRPTRSNPTKCQLADHRYGREEMLAMFDSNSNPPNNLTNNDLLYVQKVQYPIALVSDQEMDDSSRRWAMGRGTGPRLPSAIPGMRPPLLRSLGASRSIGRGVSLERDTPRYVTDKSLMDLGGSGSGARAVFRRDPNNVMRPGADWENAASAGNTPYNMRFDSNWRRQFMNKPMPDHQQPPDAWRQGGLPRSRPISLGKKPPLSWRSEEENEQDKYETGRYPREPGNEREWGGDKKPMPWASNLKSRSGESPEDLPEWANSDNLPSGGTFDSSGAFHNIDDDRDLEMTRPPLQHSQSMSSFQEKKVQMSRGPSGYGGRMGGAPGMRGPPDPNWNTSATVFNATDIQFLKRPNKHMAEKLEEQQFQDNRASFNNSMFDVAHKNEGRAMMEAPPELKRAASSTTLGDRKATTRTQSLLQIGDDLSEDQVQAMQQRKQIIIEQEQQQKQQQNERVLMRPSPAALQAAIERSLQKIEQDKMRRSEEDKVRAAEQEKRTNNLEMQRINEMEQMKASEMEKLRQVEQEKSRAAEMEKLQAADKLQSMTRPLPAIPAPIPTPQETQTAAQRQNSTFNMATGPIPDDIEYPMIDDIVKMLVLEEEETDIKSKIGVLDSNTPSNNMPAPMGPERTSPSKFNDDNLWYYRDPQSETQGPFTSQEMAEWFTIGYFPGNLQVRRGCDSSYVMLGHLLELCNGIMPFMLSDGAISLILEKDLQMQQQLHHQHLQQQQLQQHLQHLHMLQQKMQQEQLQQEQMVLANQQTNIQFPPTQDFIKDNQWGMQAPPMYRWRSPSQSNTPSPVQAPGMPAHSLLMAHNMLGPNVMPYVGTSALPMTNITLPAGSSILPPAADCPTSIWDAQNEQKAEKAAAPAMLLEQLYSSISRQHPSTLAATKEHNPLVEFLQKYQIKAADPLDIGISPQQPPANVVSPPLGLAAPVLPLMSQPPPTLMSQPPPPLTSQPPPVFVMADITQPPPPLHKIKEEPKFDKIPTPPESKPEPSVVKKETAEAALKKQEANKKKVEEPKVKKTEKDKKKKKDEEKIKWEVEKIEPKKVQVEGKKKKVAVVKEDTPPVTLVVNEPAPKKQPKQNKGAGSVLMVEKKVEEPLRPVAWCPIKEGSPDHNNILSFSDIQRLEREQRAQQMQVQLMLAQQQAAAAKERDMLAMSNRTAMQLKWVDQKPSTPAKVMSLADIQAEEQLQGAKVAKVAEKEKTAAAATALLAPNTGAIWGPPINSGSTWWNNNGSVTNTNTNTKSSGFWESSAQPTKARPEQNANGAAPRTAQPVVTTTNKTKTDSCKPAREAVTKRDQASVAAAKQAEVAEELLSWSRNTLSKLDLHLEIDWPAFVCFLKDVESPYEVKEYVKFYLGESRDTNEYARQFIEKRSKMMRKNANPIPSDDLCGPAAAVNPSFSSIDFQDAKGKARKVKKNKMTKIDAGSLGFNVTAAEDRFNIGDIVTAKTCN